MIKKSIIWEWQDDYKWSAAAAPLKCIKIGNTILFHSLFRKTCILHEAITYLFSIQALFALKWNKTRLMISITLTQLAVYSAWSLCRKAVQHKSWWWRTFTEEWFSEELAVYAGSSEEGKKVCLCLGDFLPPGMKSKLLINDADDALKGSFRISARP